MKVALLAYDYTRLKFLFGLRDLLIEKGCTVKCFTHHGDPKGEVPHEAHPWGDFRFEKLDAFGPDRLVMFNGFATATLPATLMLKDKFDTFHVEQGWLPQKGNIYIDNTATGARSNIRRNAEKLLCNKIDDFDMGMTLGEVKALYKSTGNFRPPTGNKFILVPTQLEHDTSIIYDSPLFKTMDSVVSFVRKAMKNSPYEIYVKTHPREKDKTLRSADGLQIIREGSINDIIAHENCVGVIGINSTSLIEALVHEKPVVCLGRNVASDMGAYQLEFDPDEHYTGSLKHLCDTLPKAFTGSVDKGQIYKTLYALSKLQFRRTKPPEWVYKFLKEQTFNKDWLS